MRRGVRSGDGAQAAAFLGAGPATIAGRKWKNHKHFLEKNTLIVKAKSVSTAGQCKQHL